MRSSFGALMIHRSCSRWDTSSLAGRERYCRGSSGSTPSMCPQTGAPNSACERQKA